MPELQPIIVKKKKIIAGGHHGGSWKVAYADFVTAMMAFFMVMWIMGMDESTKSMVQGYFNDPLGFVKNPPRSKTAFPIPGASNPKPGSGGTGGGGGEGRLDGERAELKNLEGRFRRELTGDAQLEQLLKNIDFEITEQGLRIEFVETSGAVFFDSGRDTILPGARKLVAKFAPLLARSQRRIIIEGHTDGVPYPSKEYTNWDLSADRAQAMRRALTFYGVPLDRFQEIRGYADTRLKRPDQPDHFSNRRVTVLLPFKVTADTEIGLPADTMREKVEGVFRQPVMVAPRAVKGGN